MGLLAPGQISYGEAISLTRHEGREQKEEKKKKIKQWLPVIASTSATDGLQECPAASPGGSDDAPEVSSVEPSHTSLSLFL